MTIPRCFTMAATLILSMMIAGCSLAQSGGNAATERNRQFIAQAFAQWAAGGRTFFQDVLSPDVT